MADVFVKILDRADNFNLMTPEQARLMMQVDVADPTGSDEYLENLIEVNSDVIAQLCNRVFARERVRETWRCITDPCDCPDGETSRRIHLSHWPVKEEDVERVESPRGYVINRNDWELDEDAGRLSLFGHTAEPIVVTYSGGYTLPDEAPPALRYAAMLLVSQARAQAQAESSTSALASGIKSISHKESRVTFQSPSEKSATSGKAGDGGLGGTPALNAVKNLLIHFTRLWA